MEQFYTRFYHQTLPEPNLPVTDASSSPNQMLAARLSILLDTALSVAPDYFGLKAQGSIIERCRRLEKAGWSYIYREDLPNVNALAPLERGLADWVAPEASLRLLQKLKQSPPLSIKSYQILNNNNNNSVADMKFYHYAVFTYIQIFYLTVLC